MPKLKKKTVLTRRRALNLKLDGARKALDSATSLHSKELSALRERCPHKWRSGMGTPYDPSYEFCDICGKDSRDGE